MKFWILLIVLISSAVMLSAQGFSITVPGASVTVTGDQTTTNNTAYANSGAVIDAIAAKLDKLDKDYHSKLNTLDQKRVKQLMDEIYTLLAMLPVDAPVEGGSMQVTSINQTPASGQSNASVNINITGMDTKPAPTPAPQTVKPAPVPTPQPVKPAEQPKPTPPPPAPAQTAQPTPIVPPAQPTQQEVQKPTTKKNVIGESDFADLKNRINKESFADGKIRVLKSATNNYSFKVDHIVALIGLYTYSSDKLKVLEMTWKDCPDKQNNFKIYDAFTFDSDKDDAASIMGD